MEATKHTVSPLAQKTWTAWLFLLPSLIVLAGVALWPLLRTIFFSFTDAMLTLPGD